MSPIIRPRYGIEPWRMPGCIEVFTEFQTQARLRMGFPPHPGYFTFFARRKYCARPPSRNLAYDLAPKIVDHSTEIHIMALGMRCASANRFETSPGIHSRRIHSRTFVITGANGLNQIKVQSLNPREKSLQFSNSNHSVICQFESPPLICQLCPNDPSNFLELYPMETMK